ncbi:hypothetical protein IL306_012361 [Fusarium sp. DS 682]|nr:hypothetical protein IL306_012361 [Fusarium sp. DS 682]
MLQMLQNSAPGQGLSWNNPFVNTDVPSFLSMDPTLDAQSFAMSFSSPESASQTVAQDFADDGLPDLAKQISHVATDALDNSTTYSGSQDFDINTLWDLDFSDLNSAPQDVLSSTESPANEQNAVQVKRRARLPSNDWSGYSNFSPSPFTSDSLIMQSSNRYLITESLLQIYHDVLENNLACWLAEDNCPYKLQAVTRATPAPEPNINTPAGPSRQNPNLPPEWGAAWSNRMYRRVVELDRAAQSARLINLTRSESQAASRVLDLVIMAFTTQWAQGNRRQEKFPMGTSDFATEADDLADALNQEFEESLQQSVWEQAKRALQDVVDVESYRVIYAELIFGLTQKPWASNDYQPKCFASKTAKSGRGIKENAMPQIIEIMSQEGPHTYLERATRKIHALKFRFEASESGFTETCKKYAPQRLTEENRRTIGLLYWLAVMFDTVSSSMNERPVALADEDCQHEDADQILADSMKAAQKSRRGSQRWEMELFIQDDATKPRVGTRWPCSYDDAMQMVSKSAPVKILIYRHLSYLQNALRKRESPQAIEEIIQQTTLLYRYWNMTHGAFFRDLIRHYDTVPPRIRSWFFCIAVPWHLGALMLADVLEFIDKNNLGLEQSRQKRLSSNIAARIRKASAIELADLAQVTTPRLFQEAGINAAQLPDYHFATNNVTTDVELQPRTAVSVTIPAIERPSDTKNMEFPKTGIPDGQMFGEQSPSSEHSQHLERTSHEVGDTPFRTIGSASQSVQSASNEAPAPEEIGMDAEVSLEVQSHSSQRVTGESERLSPKVERMLLEAIRDKILFELGATTEDVRDIVICDYGSSTMRFKFGPRDTETVELVWGSESRSKKGNQAARAAEKILGESDGDNANCLLSKRQTATIRRGSKKILLQEKRARISFRVLKETPYLFSILLLSDELMSPDIRGDSVELAWKHYGFAGRGTGSVPITHYLFEICRVFQICMDDWEETLDIIDELVHVNLDGFESKARVEELMFDKSFERSKDYFVAIQLLRIINEWLDEVASSVNEMEKKLSLANRSFYADRVKIVFIVTCERMNERVDAVRSRIQKKQEEINSLRDGVCSYYPIIDQEFTNLLSTVIQCHVPSRGHEGYGLESSNLCLHRFDGSFHTSQLLSGK